MTNAFKPRTLTTAEFHSLPPTLTTGAQPGSRPVVTQILATAQMLSASGYGDTTPLDHVRKLHDAAHAALARAQQADLYSGLDPAAVDPADVEAMVRDAATSRVLIAAPGGYGSTGLATAAEQFVASLTPAAVAGFDEFLTGAAAALRKEYAAAASKINAAAKAGLTPHTAPSDVFNSGTPAQVATYRDLVIGTQKLDALAGLWMTAIRVLNPAMEQADIVAAFVTTDAEDDRENAAGVFAGNSETVLVASENSSVGPSVQRITKPRLGGSWLALVDAGYKLTLRVPPPAVQSTTADVA